MKPRKISNSLQVRAGQTLVDDVVGLFIDLLVTGGTSVDSVRRSIAKSLNQISTTRSTMTFSEIGGIQRDCMEVMCAWRREPKFVNENGEPAALKRSAGNSSFRQLCVRARCKNDWVDVLQILLEFGAVALVADDRVVSKTPTFLSRSSAGKRLAKDVVLRQLEGYLRVVHGNVCDSTSDKKPRFERACSVTVAAELEPVFEKLVRTRGQEFVDSVDEWLERNSQRESAVGRYVELGAGAYYIDRGNRTALGSCVL